MCDALPRLACLCAAIKIHYALLTGISHAPLSFFDRTPSGRILARFSKDLEVLDTEIPTLLCDLLSTAFEVIATLSLSHAQKNAKFFLLKKKQNQFFSAKLISKFDILVSVIQKIIVLLMTKSTLKPCVYVIKMF